MSFNGKHQPLYVIAEAIRRHICDIYDFLFDGNSNIWSLIFYEIFANHIKCKHLTKKMNVNVVEKKNWSKRGHTHTHAHLQTCAEKDVKS